MRSGRSRRRTRDSDSESGAESGAERAASSVAGIANTVEIIECRDVKRSKWGRRSVIEHRGENKHLNKWTSRYRQRIGCEQKLESIQRGHGRMRVVRDESKRGRGSGGAGRPAELAGRKGGETRSAKRRRAGQGIIRQSKGTRARRRRGTCRRTGAGKEMENGTRGGAVSLLEAGRIVLLAGAVVHVVVVLLHNLP